MLYNWNLNVPINRNFQVKTNQITRNEQIHFDLCPGNWNGDGVHHAVLYNVVFIGRFDDAKRRDADVPSGWIQSLASGSSAADSRA